MKSVLILAGLWSVQGRLFDSPVPRSKIKFLGSGVRHNHTNFHAIISAKSMADVKDLMVTYSDCGKSIACQDPEPFLHNLPVSNGPTDNPKAMMSMNANKGIKDGDFTVFDIEYTYSGSPLRNHILTVFSDGLGQESIICGLGHEINQGTSENACEPCTTGTTFAELYDATCTDCKNTCPEGYRVSSSCTDNTDTDCSDSCNTITCADTHYVSEACDRGSASKKSATAGVCTVCLTGNKCPTNEYTNEICVKGSTYVKGTKARCEAMTLKNNQEVTHYLVKQGEQGDANTKGEDNKWAECTPPDNGEYVKEVCEGGLGQNTVIKTCRVCADEHRVETTACTQGDKNNQGEDAECGACLEGFTNEENVCVSRAYMFGYVVRKPSGKTCGKHCVKWSGNLNDNFAEDKIKGTPSAVICALLSDREPLLRSEECART